ncbi:MAG: hypothetical protein JWM16_6399 [Verrucomicrobiales bacterium]|nr:hypothetical protein [Verrucomicrobiales bacterium]
MEFVKFISCQAPDIKAVWKELTVDWEFLPDRMKREHEMIILWWIRVPEDVRKKHHAFFKWWKQLPESFRVQPIFCFEQIYCKLPQDKINEYICSTQKPFGKADSSSGGKYRRFHFSAETLLEEPDHGPFYKLDPIEQREGAQTYAAGHSLEMLRQAEFQEKFDDPDSEAARAWLGMFSDESASFPIVWDLASRDPDAARVFAQKCHKYLKHLILLANRGSQEAIQILVRIGIDTAESLNEIRGKFPREVNASVGFETVWPVNQSPHAGFSAKNPDWSILDVGKGLKSWGIPLGPPQRASLKTPQVKLGLQLLRYLHQVRIEALNYLKARGVRPMDDFAKKLVDPLTIEILGLDSWRVDSSTALKWAAVSMKVLTESYPKSKGGEPRLNRKHPIFSRIPTKRIKERLEEAFQALAGVNTKS